MSNETAREPPGGTPDKREAALGGLATKEAGATEAMKAKNAPPDTSATGKGPDRPGAEASSPAANGTNDDHASPKAGAVSAPSIEMRLFGRTDVGQVREHNEDNFIVADLSRGSRGLMESERSQVIGGRGALLAVCDGMGGAAAGEIASQLAVDIVYEVLSEGPAPKNHDELAARVVQAVEVAGLRIFNEAKADRSRRGMGTTATVAAVMDDHLFFGQVGDSRGYILRGGRFVQVTRDQSLVNQLIEAGQLTEEEAETFEHANIILQALGTADSVQVDLTYVELRRGDTLLLCSDGLSGMLRNNELREILLTVEDPLEACKVLTERANQAGGHDNITVVVAHFDGEGLAPPSPADIEQLRYRKYDLPEPTPPAGVATVPSMGRSFEELGAPSARPTRSVSGQPSAEPPRKKGNDSADELAPGSSRSFTPDLSSPSEDPIQIPTEGAPQWLVVMMIVSAALCIAIAGYYLLR